MPSSGRVIETAGVLVRQASPAEHAQPAARVALIHYWLVGIRGGERVLEALCRMFPQADIYTHVCLPSKLSDTLRAHRIEETFVGRLPFAGRLYQRYLPLMPRALEEIDLSRYDLVISSEAGPAKGVIPPPDAPHLCYCHSPMRDLWDQRAADQQRHGAFARRSRRRLAHRLRQWDVTSAARVDRFVANSTHVAARIEKYWRREADVVHPPVELASFLPAPASEVGDYYLLVCDLAAHTRPDLAIEACARMGRKLVVIGGPEKSWRRLSAKAGDTVSYLGRSDPDTLRKLLARCRALVLPGEEDFGFVAVEAMASGRPVIAYGRGGAFDTVIDGETGLLFEDQSVDGLTEAIEAFEVAGLDRLDPGKIAAHAQRFDEPTFRAGMERSLAGLGVFLSQEGV